MAPPTATGSETRTQPETDPTTETVRRRKRVSQQPVVRRERAKRIARRVVAGLLVLVLALLLMVWLILGRIERIPAIEGARPAHAKGLTFLVLGLDRRSAVQTTGRDARADSFVAGAQRADIIMLVHVGDDRDEGYAVSIPRDSWVDVPGHGKAKINAAYSFGGAELMVRTVQRLTGVHVDHVAVVDFEGFRQFTDAVGGVDVYFPEQVPIPGAGAWPHGVVHLDGELALNYVRQRYGLPGGDFDRIKRQQNFLRQLTAKVFSEGMLRNPVRVKALLDHVAANVSVDDRLGNLDMLRLAWSMRSFDPGSMSFYTVPHRGTGWAGRQSIVIYDRERADVMWEAFAGEDTDVLDRRFGSLSLGGVVP